MYTPAQSWRPWECAKGSDVVNPKAGGKRLETRSPKAQWCQQGALVAEGEGRAQEALQPWLPEAGPR